MEAMLTCIMIMVFIGFGLVSFIRQAEYEKANRTYWRMEREDF